MTRGVLLCLAGCLPALPTPAEVDWDGDGSLGAADCDDQNAATFPGAPEQCDGIDRDCDGVFECPLSAARKVRFTGAGPADGAGESVAVVGDVNGDGDTDLAVGAPNRGFDLAINAAPGAAYLLYGPFDADRDLQGEVTFTGSLDDRAGSQVYGLGDVIGGPEDDLLITIRRHADYLAGGLRIVAGTPPESSWTGGHTLDDVADIVLEGTTVGTDGEQLGIDVVYANLRLVAGAMYWREVGGPANTGAAYVFDLAALPAFGVARDEYLAIFIGEDPDTFLGQSVEAVDFGTGARDWLVGGAGPGPDGSSRGVVHRFAYDPSFAGIASASDADATWTGNKKGDALASYSAMDRVPDIAGREQLVVAAVGASNGSGAVYLVDADAPSSGPIGEVAVSIWEGEPDTPISSPAAGDFDQDGVPDLALLSPGVTEDAVGRVLVFLGPLPQGTLGPSAASLVFVAESSGDQLSEGMAVVPDLDGDGLDEVLVGAPSFDAEHPDGGAAYVLFGVP